MTTQVKYGTVKLCQIELETSLAEAIPEDLTLRLTHFGTKNRIRKLDKLKRFEDMISCAWLSSGFQRQLPCHLGDPK